MTSRHRFTFLRTQAMASLYQEDFRQWLIYPGQLQPPPACDDVTVPPGTEIEACFCNRSERGPAKVIDVKHLTSPVVIVLRDCKTKKVCVAF